MASIRISGGTPILSVAKRDFDKVNSKPKILAEVLENGQFITKEIAFDITPKENKGVEITVGLNLNKDTVRNIGIVHDFSSNEIHENKPLKNHMYNLLVHDLDSYDFWIKGSRDVDKESLFYVMFQSYLYLDNINMKTSCFVVLLYKAIELNFDELLSQVNQLREPIVQRMQELMDVKGASPKDDGTQQALSYFTAMWHVDIYLENFDGFIETINHCYKWLDHEKVKHKATYAVNYSKILAMQSYLALMESDFDRALHYSSAAYYYSAGIALSLSDYKPSDTVLNDFIKGLQVARKTSAIYKYVNTRLRYNQDINDNASVKSKLDKILKRTLKIIKLESFSAGISRVEDKAFESKLRKALVYNKSIDI